MYKISSTRKKGMLYRTGTVDYLSKEVNYFILALDTTPRLVSYETSQVQIQTTPMNF